MAKTRLCYEYRELLKDYLESTMEIDLYPFWAKSLSGRG